MKFPIPWLSSTGQGVQCKSTYISSPLFIKNLKPLISAISAIQISKKSKRLKNTPRMIKYIHQKNIYFFVHDKCITIILFDVYDMCIIFFLEYYSLLFNLIIIHYLSKKNIYITHKLIYGETFFPLNNTLQ